MQICAGRTYYIIFWASKTCFLQQFYIQLSIFQKQGSLIVKIMNTFTLWWTSLHDGSIWKSFFDYLLNTVPFQFSAKVVWNMQFVDNQNVHSSAAHSARCLQSSSRIENVRELPFQQFFTEKLPRAIIFHAWSARIL